jgi:uncharacterized membrane protein (UPF0182 family)
MGRDLDDALNAVFAQEGTTTAQRQQALAGQPVTGSLSVLAQQALEHYDRARAYLKKADWSKYGEELNRLEAILKKMAPKKKTPPQKAP